MAALYCEENKIMQTSGGNMVIVVEKWTKNLGCTLVRTLLQFFKTSDAEFRILALLISVWVGEGHISAMECNVYHSQCCQRVV